jgi:ribosomal protein S17E
MTKGVEFQKKKAELINSYKEYLTLLEDFQLSDAHNINVLEELAKAHAKTSSKSIAFTEFMSSFREKPTEEK